MFQHPTSKLFLLFILVSLQIVSSELSSNSSELSDSFFPSDLSDPVECQSANPDSLECKKTCPEDDHHSNNGIQLFSFRWKDLGVYFTISSFIVFAGLAKLGFHKLHWLSSKVPESCLLVILGLGLGLILSVTTDTGGDSSQVTCGTNFVFPEFTQQLFFNVLLPPIILDSAYALHDRVFLDNLGTVLIFAVVGTLFSSFAIGGTLYGVHSAGLIPNMNLTVADSFVFSSLISAVDPVAVLAIFQELGVNQNLYFLIFGESLLNDGVTVALYNALQAMRLKPDIESHLLSQVMLAILYFFIVSFGGIIVGVFYGLLTALFTKYTESVRVVEPLAVLGLAYICYITSELFHFSGIISLIICGIVQAHFSFYNISQKSYICVKYFIKMASATSDTIIFMFLGMVLVKKTNVWDTEFVLWSVFLCLIYRFIAIFALSAMVNMNRSRRIDLEEQFILAYGGLRGAVAFSLAIMLDKNLEDRNIYILTTLMVILFTVFIQGITIKPLVHLLNIQKRRGARKKLNEEIIEKSMDHVMAGMEEVLGHHGGFYLREICSRYIEKYLKPFFIVHNADTKLTKLFEKITLEEHYAHLYGSTTLLTEPNGKVLTDDFINDKLVYDPVANMIQEELKLKSSADSKRSPTTRRQSSIRNIMSVRRRSTIAQEPPPPPIVDGGDATVLRRAFRDNRYNKLHYTYNPNLVNEEDQEISEHLNRRSILARRMSMLASAQHHSNPEEYLPGQVPDAYSGPSLRTLSRAAWLLQRSRKSSLLFQRISGLGAVDEDSTVSPPATNGTRPAEFSGDNDERSSSISVPPEIKVEDIPLLEIKRTEDDK